jgi:hypothetical protein
MLTNSPEMPQHLILALEHHKALIEDARRHHQANVARMSPLERPMRWRRVRSYAGEWLICFGERLKSGASDRATDTVWG